MILSLVIFVGTFAVVFAGGFWVLELGALWSTLAACAVATLDVAIVQQFRRWSRPIRPQDAMRITMTASMLIVALSLFSSRLSENVLMMSLSLGAAACSAAVVIAAWIQLQRLGTSER